MSEPHKPGPRTIAACLEAHQRVVQALERDGELAGDEAALCSMLRADPNVVSPDELLRRFVGAIAFAEARADEAAAFAKGMKARADRYEARAQAMRDEMLVIMQLLERTSFTGSPFGTVSVRAGRQSVVVLDEEKLPDEYWRVSRALDRMKLREDLTQGVVIDGAVLSNPMPVLSIRAARGARAAVVEAE